MNDGFVKSPDAALRFVLPFGKLRAGSVPVTVSLSNRARLAGACPGEGRGPFYEAVPFSRLFTRSS
jgi:hypothetical protein